MTDNLLITNIGSLVQVRDATPTFIAGAAQADLPVIPNAYLSIREGRIHQFGPMDELEDKESNVIDATGRLVFPSFVDSHTHLVFSASREQEFVMKIKGASYAEISARGGGILHSARALQQMSEEQLLEQTMARAQEIIRTGTGAVEIKSGYGLTVKDELKMLRVARQVGIQAPLTVKTTFLGAHAVPWGMKKEDYITMILREMIPAVAEERLADYIDVFCEDGFFSPDETIEILEEGKRFGMRPRLHANQLSRSGGVQVGVRVGAISVDHLENIGAEEIELLKGSSTMPTALPNAAFFLDLPFPPARKMLDEGLPLALATDYNPGSAPSGNVPLMLSLACIGMKLTPEEAINGATINSAWSLELLESLGSITVGKVANVFITKPMPSLAYMPYAFGSNPVECVVLNGKVVASVV